MSDQGASQKSLTWDMLSNCSKIQNFIREVNFSQRAAVINIRDRKVKTLPCTGTKALTSICSSYGHMYL